MYRKLLASTALILVATGGAYSQEMAPADPMAPAEPAMEAPAEMPQQELVTAEEKGISADGWLATEILGETIYNSTGDDAESIGEVNDFVLDQNGAIGAVVVGVGGFLGIGQKNVAINWDDLELAQDMDGNNRLVAAMTREQLEAAAEFNREEWLASEARAAAERAAAESAVGDPMAPAAPAPMAPAAPPPADDAMAPAAPVDDAAAPEAAPADEAAAPAEEAAAPEAEPAEDAAAAPADDAAAEPADDAAAAPADDAAAPADDAAAAPADDAAAAPADDAAAAEASADAAVTAPAFDSFEQVATADISADELNGTAVYGAGDEEIGSIGDIILSEDGAVQAVIVDFGGFLGIGTKPVAVGFDNLSFLRDENGALVLRTSLTAEQLEAAPEYNEEAYTAAPADNSLIVE